MTFEGPAIVEEVDSTAVIGPGTTVTVDAYANLVATFHAEHDVLGSTSKGAQRRG